MTRAGHETWTTRRLLGWMTEAFGERGLDSPRLMAELLVAHVIGCDRLRLYMDQDRPASGVERQVLRDLVKRALGHEPVQYLVGEAWFFGLGLHVDRRVLIPRGSSETIVDHVLHHARAVHGASAATGDHLLIADVGTGSGNLAVALLKNLPGARVIATDVSPGALEVARRNAERHGVLDRIELLEGSLLEPLAGHPVAGGRGSLDYLVSNPPYIPDDEWADVAPNVRDHEPEAALRGGPEGMDLVGPLIEGAPALVREGGLVLIEVASARAGTARDLMSDRPEIHRAHVLEDCDALPRIVVGEVGSVRG